MQTFTTQTTIASAHPLLHIRPQAYKSNSSSFTTTASTTTTTTTTTTATAAIPSSSSHSSQSMVQLFCVVFAKAMLILSLTFPCMAVLTALSNPYYAKYVSYFFTVFVTSSTILAAANGGYRERSFKITSVPCSVFWFVILSYLFGFAGINIFVSLMGLVGVLLAESVLLLSILLGQHRDQRLKQFLVAVGMASPILFGFVSFVPSYYYMYKFGTCMSLICSLTNLFFNKTSGVPTLIQTPTTTSTTSVDTIKGGKIHSKSMRQLGNGTRSPKPFYGVQKKKQ